MSYVFKAQDAFDFAHSRGITYKQKGDELFFKICPYCKGGTSEDKNTFSINLDNGTYNCFRASCGKHGHFVELARDFTFPLELNNQAKKKFRSLPQKKPTPTNDAYAFMASRGISVGTVDLYKITTQKSNGKVLVFPFFDENNVLVSVKYRKVDFDRSKDTCKEWFEKATKPILFGMAQCEDFEQLIITEGQIDSLSVADCGYKNAVSVPTGAKGFTWLTHCWDWVAKFKEVIIFGDFENGTMSLIDELEKRLPQKVKAVRQEDYLGEKDANDIYRKYGRQAIENCIERAEIRKLKNVKDLSEVKKVDLSELPKIKTNIKELDAIIGGLIFGQVVLLSGKRGEGKSTLMSQLVCEALEQGESVFIYSGELPDFHFKSWLDLQLAGKDNIIETGNDNGTPSYRIPDDVTDRINRWYAGRAFIYDNNFTPEEKGEYEGIVTTIENVIKQFDTRVICIDNLMTAMETVTEQNNLYLAQSNFVGKLKKIAVKYNVVIILVAHPRKTVGDVKNDDVSGSSDITNKVDVVMSYQREYSFDFDGIPDYDGTISVTKNRLSGRLASGEHKIKLCFSPATKRIVSAEDKTIRHYSWEKETVTHDGFEYDIVE